LIKQIESTSANRFLLFGIVVLLIGLIAVIWPLMVEKGLLWIIGLLMIVGGCTQAFKGLQSGERNDKSFNLIAGLLFAVIGIVIIVCWFSLLAFFTLIIGILFLLQGVWTLMVALSARHAQGHLVMVLSGVLSVIIAILILARWPSSSEYVVGILFGINLIFCGAAMLALGSTLKNTVPAVVTGHAEPVKTTTSAEASPSAEAKPEPKGGS
jgi:uncharacterized membrane protein HdeD (DUF308 family)